MNDMNRLLIFLLLTGLLFALYKYQHLIFGQNQNKIQNPIQPKQIKSSEDMNNKLKYNPSNNKKKDINIDNISQMSLGSLDDENGSPNVYKQDSILGSTDDGSLLSNSSNGTNNTNNSLNSNNSRASKNSSFFF